MVCVDYLRELSGITGETIYGILSRHWKADFELADPFWPPGQAQYST